MEDWELILRIARQWKIGFVDEILVEVHKMAGGVSTNTVWYLITRCYLVSLYRREMEEAGMLDGVREEISEKAKIYGLYDEISELLNRNIEL